MSGLFVATHDPYGDLEKSEYPGRDQDTWHKEPIGKWSVYHFGHDSNIRWTFWDDRCRPRGAYLTKEEATAARDACQELTENEGKENAPISP